MYGWGFFFFIFSLQSLGPEMGGWKQVPGSKVEIWFARMPSVQHSAFARENHLGGCGRRWMIMIHWCCCSKSSCIIVCALNLR